VNYHGLGLTLAEAMQLQFEVEAFLNHEAHLLDSRRYQEWLELASDDIHYWMPIRRTTLSDDLDNEFTRPGDMAYFDDDKEYLSMRISRLLVGKAWAEDPPSRTRHMISNVRVVGVEGRDITVELNFHLYRTRLESEEDSWVGRRRDVLRREGDGFLLARRHIYLDQTTILSQNLSTIF
jgi:3-phenylpropionate/cinnamic acid dioxygenase small subunit